MSLKGWNRDHWTAIFEKTHFGIMVFVFPVPVLQMTAEALLRLVNDPVLPFYPLDITLDVQNKLKGE